MPISPTQYVPLHQLVRLQRGYDLPTPRRRDGQIPILGSFGITGWHDTAKAKGPGLTIGRSGASIGVATYCDGPFWPLNTTLYVSDFLGNDPKFVFYVLKAADFRDYNSGSAQPSLNRNYLSAVRAWRPAIPIQRRVAFILSAYDDLIENNTRRIQILEEMAQAIYREWFVEFRFPGHEGVRMVDSELGPIPEGWRVEPLFSLASVTFGLPFKSKLFNEAGRGTPLIRIRDIPNHATNTYTTEDASADYRVADGDILIGMDGEFHMCVWPSGTALLNQRVARLRPSGDIGTYELFLALRRPISDLNASIVGTTVAHLGKRHLEQLRLVVPPPSAAHRITDILRPSLELQINLRKQNTALRATRDLLLPRLISGEIDVSRLDAGSTEPAA